MKNISSLIIFVVCGFMSFGQVADDDGILNVEDIFFTENGNKSNIAGADDSEVISNTTAKSFAGADCVYILESDCFKILLGKTKQQIESLIGKADSYGDYYRYGVHLFYNDKSELQTITYYGIKPNEAYTTVYKGKPSKEVNWKDSPSKVVTVLGKPKEESGFTSLKDINYLTYKYNNGIELTFYNNELANIVFDARKIKNLPRFNSSDEKLFVQGIFNLDKVPSEKVGIFAEVNNVDYKIIEEYQVLHKGKYYIKATDKLIETDYKTGHVKEIKIPSLDDAEFTDNFLYYSLKKDGQYNVFRMDVTTGIPESLTMGMKFERFEEARSVNGLSSYLGLSAYKNYVSLNYQRITRNKEKFISITNNLIIFDNETKARFLYPEYVRQDFVSGEISYTQHAGNIAINKNQSIDFLYNEKNYKCHDIGIATYNVKDNGHNEYTDYKFFEMPSDKIQVTHTFYTPTDNYFVAYTYDESFAKVVEQSLYKVNFPQISRVFTVKITGNDKFYEHIVMKNKFYIVTTKKLFQYDLDNKKPSKIIELQGNTIFYPMCRDIKEDNQATYFKRINTGFLIGTMTDKGLATEKEEYVYLEENGNNEYTYKSLSLLFAESYYKPSFLGKACGKFYEKNGNVYYLTKSGNSDLLFYSLDLRNQQAKQIVPQDFGKDQFFAIEDARTIDNSLFFKAKYKKGKNYSEKVLKYLLE